LLESISPESVAIQGRSLNAFAIYFIVSSSRVTALFERQTAASPAHGGRLQSS
jgi:hypothetical protein